jgi:hypothetical protein
MIRANPLHLPHPLVMRFAKHALRFNDLVMALIKTPRNSISDGVMIVPRLEKFFTMLEYALREAAFLQ